MNYNTEINIGGFRITRIAQHVLFWLCVFILFIVIYSVKSTYLIAFHNNLYFLPVHIMYFYSVAYWLIPHFLFKGRYLGFTLWLFVIIIVSAFICRLIDIEFANPYVVRMLPGADPSYRDEFDSPFLKKLSNKVSFVNAVKGSNLVVWFAIFIKLFKLWLERKQAALQAELDALKAQIHPHFLFNTLNNLYGLVLTKSDKSPQVVLGLSEMLRYMLYECNVEVVSLAKEVLMLQQYIALEKLRYEDRIDINFNISGDLENKLIAPLIMLPFVENAFKHGASDMADTAWINIDLSVCDDQFKFKVSNCKPETPDYIADNSGNIGLNNVAKRLNLLYPNRHQLKIMDEGDAFLVVLDLTLQYEQKTGVKLVVA